VIDRVDHDDNPKRVLVVDDLDAYEAYEFRVLLHQTTAGPHGAHGSIIQGPSTGALLVDMLDGELTQAPVATALGSAAVHVAWPKFSQCRKNLGIEVQYWNEGYSSSWQRVEESEVQAAAKGIILHQLRCPLACQFKLRYANLLGKASKLSAPSEPVTSLKLPACKATKTRLELKYAPLPPPDDSSMLRQSTSGELSPWLSAWRNQFSRDLAQALGLKASDAEVVEVRGLGEYVVFDLSSNYENPSGAGERGTGRATPTSRLHALMAEPACMENLALHQPGRCSSSCDMQSGASPGRTNDGDIRQYHPRHTWQACPGEPSAWWGVDLGLVRSNPYVRMFMGPCCSQSYDSRLVIRIGQDSAPETARTCGQLLVRDGSAAGVICNGTGSWIFIVAAPRLETTTPTLSLAEVQVCSSDRMDGSLFRGPGMQMLDTSAGLLRFSPSADQPTQIAQELLPFSTESREAPWRLPHQARVSAFSGLLWTLGLGALATACVVATFMFGRACLQRWSSLPRQRVTDSISAAEQADHECLVSDEFDERETPHSDLGEKVDVTFETSDGNACSALLDIGSVHDVGQLISAVKSLASSALGSPVDHVSVQYRNESTGETEQAWFDPILGESSSITAAKRAGGLRVLVL